MTLALSTSLREAKEWLRKRLDEGETCPLCSQHAQVYRWSLYSTAVRALMFYYQLGGTHDFVHSSDIKVLGHQGQGDAARLRWWGLVERSDVLREDGGKPGLWRVTDQGESFIFARTTILKYVHVYDGRVLRFSGPNVNIRDALGTKFSYDELVKNYSPL